MNFFFTLFWISYQVSDAFEGPFPVAPYFNKEIFGVPVRFPDLFPCECQYTRWYAGEGHFMTNCMKVMQCIVHRLHKTISVFAMTLTKIWAGYIGTDNETNRENVQQQLAWVATPNRPLLKWGARGNVLSKASPSRYDIQNSVKKKIKDVLML